MRAQEAARGGVGPAAPEALPGASLSAVATEAIAGGLRGVRGHHHVLPQLFYHRFFPQPPHIFILVAFIQVGWGRGYLAALGQWVRDGGGRSNRDNPVPENNA